MFTVVYSNATVPRQWIQHQEDQLANNLEHDQPKTNRRPTEKMHILTKPIGIFLKALQTTTMQI